MSFQAAEDHATKALGHIKTGNAAKAMHHIGHAMAQLRSKTSGAGRGVVKLPSDNSAPVSDMKAGGAPQMDNDADDPMQNDPNRKAPSPAAGSLRARLASAKPKTLMSAGGGGY